MRETYEAMIAHCGGADFISETKRMVARRVAALETELCFAEDKIARLRSEGEEPGADLIDLYQRLCNTHRRQAEVLGWERTAKDITLTIISEAKREAQRKGADT